MSTLTSDNFTLSFLNNYELTLNILKLKLPSTHDNKLNDILHPNNISKTKTKTRNSQRTSNTTIDQNNNNNYQEKITDTIDKWLVNLSHIQLPLSYLRYRYS